MASFLIFALLLKAQPVMKFVQFRESPLHIDRLKVLDLPVTLIIRTRLAQAKC